MAVEEKEGSGLVHQHSSIKSGYIKPFSLSIGVGGGVGAVCFCHLVASGAICRWNNFISLVVSLAHFSNVELT